MARQPVALTGQRAGEGQPPPPPGEGRGGWHLPTFRPALLAALPEMTSASVAKDLVAGVVVGIVAVPLALAFAIASGVPPAAGLVTAIVAGFLISALGGSRVQIGGPTGAFVVIILGIVQGFSIGELAVATVMAGVILIAFGLFRMGQLIKFIPGSVVTGFTTGIGVIIFLTQVPEILGVRLERQPRDTLDRFLLIAAHAPDVTSLTIALAAATVVTILAFKRFQPRIPGPVVALIAFTTAALVFQMPVETIGSRFGGLPAGLPAPALPELSLATMQRMLPSALTIALLGGIESLLSAVVADGMTNRRHDSNQELVAQGIANVASPLFGGIPATGAIARTATNVQNGASSPIAGMTHAAVLLVFIFIAAPAAAAIPLVLLAGILTVVSYNMSDLPKFHRMLTTAPRSDRVVLLATFLLTVFMDLTVAVQVGIILAAFLFMRSMSIASQVNLLDPDQDARYQQHVLQPGEVPPGVLAYSIDGPFFFGAAENFLRAFESIAGRPRVVILRMRHVPYMDATGLAALERIVDNLRRQGIEIVLSAVQQQPMELMIRACFLGKMGDANIQPNIHKAIERAKALVARPPPAPASSGGPAEH
jgi:sulfate permease, SulP family